MLRNQHCSQKWATWLNRPVGKNPPDSTSCWKWLSKQFQRADHLLKRLVKWLSNRRKSLHLLDKPRTNSASPVHFADWESEAQKRWLFSSSDSELVAEEGVKPRCTGREPYAPASSLFCVVHLQHFASARKCWSYDATFYNIHIESVYIFLYHLKGRWIFFHVKFKGNLHN